MIRFVKRNSLGTLSLFALFVGTGAVSSACWFTTHQPKCPEELLK
ncbi:cyclic lactone autoinducer peptide [Lutibacter sp. B2]|nr:cyclic lactone autoinducer peptide [Lutibacter sp. B2]